MKDNIGLLKKLDYQQNLSKISYDKIDSNGNKTCYDVEYGILELIMKHKNTPDDIYKNNKNIIITQDISEKDGKKCFNIINKATLDKVILNNNHFCYEYITSKKNIWYKLPIDIEYQLNKRPDNDDEINKTLTEIMKDIIDFINENLIDANSKKLNYDDYLITNSSGYKNENLFRYSYHIIINVILKWENAPYIGKLLIDEVFSKYNTKYANIYNKNVIDPSIYSLSKNFRMIYQTKRGSDRINKPLYDNELPSKYLVGLYENNTDITKYSVISKIKDDTDEISNKIEEKFIDKLTEIKKDLGINENRDFTKETLSLDYISCLLFTIPNDIHKIQRKEWCKIIGNIFGIVQLVKNNIKDIECFSGFKNKINIDDIDNHFINILTKWTIEGYDNYIKKNNIYNTYNLIKLKTIAKENGIKNFSKLNKQELINCLNPDKIVREPDEKHFEEVKRVWKSYNNYENFKEYKNYYKASLWRLEKQARIFNSKITKNWEIHNLIPKQINLDNQDFYENKDYPDFGTDKFIEDTISFIVIYFQIFMGGNKTGFSIDVLFYYMEKSNYSVLFVLPRVLLTNSITDRINNDDRNKDGEYKFYSYMNSKNQVDMSVFKNDDKNKRNIISLPSIHKLEKTYDLLVFDELDTTCDLLLADIYKGNKIKVVNTLNRLIDNAKKILFLEALPSPRSIYFTKYVLNRKDSNKCLTYLSNKLRFKQKYILRTSYKHHNKDPVRHKFLEELYLCLKNGMKVNGCITNRDFANSIGEELTKRGFKILIIDAYNKSKNSKYCINGGKKITEEKFDAVFWTTTGAVGWSEENDNYWNVRFGYYQAETGRDRNSISVNIFLQSLMRCRYANNIDNDECEEVSNEDDNDNIDISKYLDEIDKQYNGDFTLKDCYTNLDNTIHHNYLFLSLPQNLEKNMSLDTIDISKKFDLIKDINIKNLSKDLQGITNVKEVNEIIDWESKYINGDVKKELIENYDEIEDEYTNKVKYSTNNNANVFTIDETIITKLENADLLFDKKTYNFLKEMYVLNTYLNNINSKYFEEYLRETILKIGNIWDDNDVIRKFAKNNNDIIDKQLTKIDYEIDNQEIKKQIRNNHITDNSLYEFYQELENRDENGKADLKYDTIKMSKIEQLFITYTYFNIDKMYDTNDDYVDSKIHYENEFEKIVSSLLNDRVSGKVIRNLILYYHIKLNHFNIKGKLNYIYHTIKFINDEIIELDSLFKSKKEYKYDNKGKCIGCNFTDIKIDGLKIINNESKIIEFYNDYMLKEGIKTPLYIGKTSSINKDLVRFTKTTKSKLEFLLFELFGIKIDNLPNRRKVRKEGKEIKFYDYMIYYDDKDYLEIIHNYLDCFNFDERKQLIQNKKLEFIPESDEEKEEGDYDDCDYKEDNGKKQNEINNDNEKKSNENAETSNRINEEIEWYKANGTTKEEASKEYAKYCKRL
jgi:hypothetical protein